ncbi:MAG: GNAT family N-acetyltransferase [Gelidibacter sp.]|nr:GNAT family N-acetyltransferase [Gelidibacter sp.]
MTYSSDTFYIEHLQYDDALHLNKLLVSNTERLKRFLPKTLAANRTLESTKSYIISKIEAMQSNTEFVFTIKDKYTRNIAGLVILKNLDWDKKQGEFAYCIGEKFEGKGWMSEAVKATSKYAIHTLGLTHLQIIAHKKNYSSVKVAEKSGFSWRKTLKAEFTPINESPIDMELYELRNEG